MNEVPYPPPPARAESIPARKTPGDVWLDGQWDWNGKVWKWTAGGWVTAPENAYFTPWTTKRRADGQLLFARAAWRDSQGRAIGAGVDACAPPGAAALPGQVAKR